MIYLIVILLILNFIILFIGALEDGKAIKKYMEIETQISRLNMLCIKIDVISKERIKEEIEKIVENRWR